MQAVLNPDNPDVISGIQVDFSGGMNLYLDDSKISPNEYREAFNVRNRTGGLTPVTQAVELSTAPSGLKQGIYGFDTFFVLFVMGKAYYQIVGTTTWVRISQFQMSTTAPIIYTQAVPASSINSKRVLQTASNFLGTGLNPAINLSNTSINGTPAGLVCQDGINQPWIILSDKSARLLQTYDEWELEQSATSLGREYVPIGKQMTIIDGILLLASPDGKQLYRSVSGRPVDFVVNIDINGNKGGNASTVSYAASYNPMTCLRALNSGQIFIGTTYGNYVVTLDYNNKIFGEPKFLNNSPLESEVTNHFSFLDILGDYAFVGYSGMRSFNAVLQLKNEARNSVFSLRIARMFEGIVQSGTQTCAVLSDNYALFSVHTIYGYGILAYDTIKQNWNSFDITPQAIKMLAITNIQTSPRVFGISEDKVYELYSVDQPKARPFVRFGSIISGSLKRELKTSGFRAAFSHSNTVSTAKVTEVMDERRGASITLTLIKDSGGLNYSVDYPAYWNSKKRVNNLYFDFGMKSSQGYKLGAFLTWGNDAQLLQFQTDAEVQNCIVPQQQQDYSYANTD